MQQVIHSLATGAIEVIEVSRPTAGRGELVVANEYSIVSSGTERMLVSFGSATMLGKLRREPGRAQEVINKVFNDGIAPTVEAVRARLQEPMPLGYSSSGIVVEVGEGVEGFSVGDRVATNGPHAEIVRVSVDQAAKIPPGVPTQDAAYTALAGVALRALQEAEVGVGDDVAILGFGLIGRLAARLARASGCRVLAYDIDPSRADSEPEVRGSSRRAAFDALVRSTTEGAGVDAVLITTDVGDRAAGADPMEHAESLAKFRGRIVLVGGGDPTLNRREFYAKELRFSVSHSYGGVGTFTKVLDLLADGRVEFATLTECEFPLDDAAAAYRALRGGEATGALAFSYRTDVTANDVVRHPVGIGRSPGSARVAVAGAGNFATRILLPSLLSAGADIRHISSGGGLSAALAARKFGVAQSSTDFERILRDPEIETVFVATRHDSHATLAERVLEAGKNLWLEKPVALRRDELDRLEQAWRARPLGVIAMVGFNRRFAPVVNELESYLGTSPKTFTYRVNAGVLPAEHWLLDPNVGGGRILGEAIHFVDLLRHLAGAPIETMSAHMVDPESGTLTVRFTDGSIGTIQYLANSSSRLAKEELEVFEAGVVYRVENFRRLRVYGARPTPGDWWRKLRSNPLGGQNKGHAVAVQSFLTAVQTRGPSPIPFHESLEVTRALFDALGME